MQQATSLIGACRTTMPCENQKLNSVMSRGGLLFIKPQFQKILVIAERNLCRKTQVSYLHEIDVKKITYDLVNCQYIKEYFVEIVEESELNPSGIVIDMFYMASLNYISRLEVFQLQKIMLKVTVV